MDLETTEVIEAAKTASILDHIKQPHNLTNYLLFTAWCKLMGISSYIPSVTIG
jgi:hypothetical protein